MQRTSSPAEEAAAAAAGPPDEQAEPDVVEHREPQRLVTAEGAMDRRPYQVEGTEADVAAGLVAVGRANQSTSPARNT